MDRALSCKLLLFEDNTEIRTMLVDFFVGQGAIVAAAEDGQNALERIREEKPDIILLDVVMPFQDGLSILSALRAEGIELPVLMLTDKNDLEDRVIGLELGADDYLAKPFYPQELLARVKALARRKERAEREQQQPLQLGPLTIDSTKRQVRLQGQRLVFLTKTEFDLLRYLAQKSGVVISRAELMQEVLGYDPEVQSKSLSMHIGSIRRKLEEAEGAQPFTIKSVSGVGYTLVIPPNN